MEKEAKPVAPGLEPLEIMGSLMVRLIHDLTNQLTILGGNAQVLEMVKNNPGRLDQVIDRIRRSSTNAGELLDAYARFRQRMRVDAGRVPVADGIKAIRANNPFPEQWTVEANGPIEGDTHVAPRWMAYLAWQVVLLCRANYGKVVVGMGKFPENWSWPGHVPAYVREKSRLLQVEVLWASDQPWLNEKEAAKPSSLELASVYELVRLLEGWVHYHYLSTHQNCFCMFLPFASDDEE